MKKEIIEALLKMAEAGKFTVNGRIDLKLLLLEEDKMLGRV